MKFIKAASIILLSLPASAAPLYFNSSEVLEDGIWDWENKGYIIGGGGGIVGSLL